MTIVDLLRDDPVYTLLDVAWLTAPVAGIIITLIAAALGQRREAILFTVITALQVADVTSRTWLGAPLCVGFVLVLGELVLVGRFVIVAAKRHRQQQSALSRRREAIQRDLLGFLEQ